MKEAAYKVGDIVIHDDFSDRTFKVLRVGYIKGLGNAYDIGQHMPPTTPTLIIKDVTELSLSPA